MRRRGKAVDGILLLDKPSGMTSNRTLQTVRRLLNARKAGHTGSLDPAATGMLPLCFGEATKVCPYLLESDKAYRVVARLGAATDTGDADGEAVREADVPTLDKAEWRDILEDFRGESLQTPPMYSALKQDGQRLHTLARQGKTVERRPRPVVVHEIRLLEVVGRRLVFRVHCSKGTYVRALVEDIAARAGTVAYTAALHREAVGGFDAAGLLSLGAMQRLAGEGQLEERLLPPDTALMSMPAVDLDEEGARRFAQGMAVAAEAGAGLVRVYGPEGTFIGIGSAAESAAVQPERVFNLAEKTL